MTEGWSFVVAGAVLGISGGLAPGPLTALVLSETLRGGPRAGLQVAIAPVLTDGPLLALSALAVGALSGVDAVLGAISAVGAAFLVWLAKETWSAELPEPGAATAEGALEKSIRRR